MLLVDIELYTTSLVVSAATPQVESTAPPAVPQVSTQRPTWYQRARDAVGTLLRGLPPLRGGAGLGTLVVTAVRPFHGRFGYAD